MPELWQLGFDYSVHPQVLGTERKREWTVAMGWTDGMDLWNGIWRGTQWKDPESPVAIKLPPGKGFEGGGGAFLDYCALNLSHATACIQVWMSAQNHPCSYTLMPHLLMNR
jgi:hypothetical protein